MSKRIFSAMLVLQSSILLLDACIGKNNQEDLGILYSNRAASYLKDGNCAECIKDCTA